MLRTSLSLGRANHLVVLTSTRSVTNKYTPLVAERPIAPLNASSHVSGVIATVFGSTGFVGRYVVSRLGDQGSQVILPYRGTENGFRHLRVLGDLGQIVPMACDVWRPEQIQEACAQSNLVINLIGSRWNTKNFSMDDTNHVIADNIARGARAAGVRRFIHVSALGAKDNATSEFAKTKYLGEIAVRNQYPDATILRPSTLFGFEDHLLNRWAGVMRFWPVVPLVQGIADRREAPMSAINLADAIKRCIFDRKTIGKIFELQGDKVFTTKDLIDLVRATTYLETREVDVPFQVMKALTGVTEHFLRKPRFTSDELVFQQEDNLVSGQYPGLKDLNVNPVDLEAVAVKHIRHYRKPKFINEL